MSYNTELQSNNAEIESNNTDLQSILDTINALPDATGQATLEITVDATGLITATAGEKSATKQLPTYDATTVTPSTVEQTVIEADVYTTGAIKVAGDSDLVAGNIVSGKSIFGVTGTAKAMQEYTLTWSCASGSSNAYYIDAETGAISSVLSSASTQTVLGPSVVALTYLDTLTPTVSSGAKTLKKSFSASGTKVLFFVIEEDTTVTFSA